MDLFYLGTLHYGLENAHISQTETSYPTIEAYRFSHWQVYVK